jgi:dTMP kinase
VFITLEGGEGAGKSTQARLLAEALRARGETVLLTREPGGSPAAEALREFLLRRDLIMPPLAEVLLHIAARFAHVERTIQPALDRHETVVCDRFSDSTIAYQGYGLGVDLDEISLHASAVSLVPDLTLVLDVSEEIAAERLRVRGRDLDRYERLGPDFHARVRAGFRAIAASAPERCVLIDAAGPPEAVHAAIMQAVLRRRPSGASA